MTELNYPLPEIGEASLSADPRTLEALINIKAWAAGQIDSTNLKALGVTLEKLAAESVNESKLTKEVAELLNNKTAGGETKKSIIATEQERTNAAYGVLATPDEVTVTLPTNGLIAVWYQAHWQNSVSNTGRAAIFLGTNQVKRFASASNPVVGAAMSDGGNVNVMRALFSTPGYGLLTPTTTFPTPADGTTGQIFGCSSTTTYGAEEEGSPVTVSNVQAQPGGPVYLYAAAGTYKISVQFKSSSGNVKVKERKLWAFAIA